MAKLGRYRGMKEESEIRSDHIISDQIRLLKEWKKGKKIKKIKSLIK